MPDTDAARPSDSQTSRSRVLSIKPHSILVSGSREGTMRLHASFRIVLSLLTLLIPAAAHAQDGTDTTFQAPSNRPIHVTTFVSQGSFASSRIGAAIEF